MSAWNWGTLHVIVEALEVLPPETWVGARYGGGAYLEDPDVAIVLRALREQVLPLLAPGERVTMKGEITSVPDDGTFHRDDLVKSYSLDRDVLVHVIDFLAAGRGRVTIY